MAKCSDFIRGCCAVSINGNLGQNINNLEGGGNVKENCIVNKTSIAIEFHWSKISLWFLLLVIMNGKE